VVIVCALRGDFLELSRDFFMHNGGNLVLELKTIE